MEKIFSIPTKQYKQFLYFLNSNKLALSIKGKKTIAGNIVQVTLVDKVQK